MNARKKASSQLPENSLQQWVWYLAGAAILFVLMLAVSQVQGPQLKTQSVTDDSYFTLSSNSNSYTVSSSGTDIAFTLQPSGSGTRNFVALQVDFENLPSEITSAAVTKLVSSSTASVTGGNVDNGRYTVIMDDDQAISFASPVDVFKVHFNVNSVPSGNRNISFKVIELSDGNFTPHGPSSSATLTLVPGSSSNSNANSTGTLTVNCTAQGGGNCVGASVDLNGQPKGQIQSDGSLIIVNVPHGVHSLSLNKPGYEAYTAQVTISSASNTKAVILVKTPSCTSNDECKPTGQAPYCSGMNETTSWSCTNGSCVYQSTNESPRCTDKICRNEQCVVTVGTGLNRCQTNVDCQMQLQNIYIITNPFNNLMIGYQVQGNTIQLTATPAGQNPTWFVRGTGGGTLNTYVGSPVIYNPGTTNGMDVVSVSFGTNKAYLYITTKYVGGNRTFDIVPTNLVQTQGTFPLNISVGADLSDTVQLKALGENRDPATNTITYKDLTAQVIFVSTKPEVGDIVPGGLFSAVQSGETSITATLDGVTSNALKIKVNPSFPSVSPAGYEPHLNPNPVARGYSTRLWVYVESDKDLNDLKIVSADLSSLNIAPTCTGSGTTVDNCNSLWKMTPAEFEGKGRWYYLEFRVPFTVLDGTYPLRLQATSMSGQIDRHLTLNLRVVAEVIPGDVNGDGQVTLLDAVFALQTVAGIKAQTHPQVNIFADINGNGRIDLAEVIFVLRKINN